MKRKFHVRFGTGGGAGNCPTDHNWAAPCIGKPALGFICSMVDAWIKLKHLYPKIHV